MKNNLGNKNNKNKKNIARSISRDDSGCCSDKNYCDIDCAPKNDENKNINAGCGCGCGD